MDDIYAICRAEAEAHARAEYPREAVGLVVSVGGKPRYLPGRNMSAEADRFSLHPDDYADAEDMGQIVAVVHSHPNAGPEPSRFDVASHSARNQTWWIVGLPAGDKGPALWHEMSALGELPLEGRTFVHGAVDCYTLIRDYYKRERGVVLPDFVREDGWWNRGQNLYVDNFHAVGFVPVDAPQEGDVLLLRITASPNPCHGAIWLPGDVILHHLPGRLSCREVYGRAYRERTTHILRYVGHE